MDNTNQDLNPSMENEQLATSEAAPAVLDSMRGVFVETLKRSNRKIREDRAIVIVEAAQLKYKREIEDMQMKMKQLKRQRDGLLDLSPTTADSLVLASDFDEKAFVENDIKIGTEIRNLNIRLQIANERYNLLFN